jgi:Uma2 family endonuclease
MFWNSYIPLELPEKESMTEEEFFKFCAANQHIKIERDENHQILIMAPAGLESSYQNGQVYAALNTWNLKEQEGKSFESSAGFTLPDTSVRSPDAAWLSNEKWKSLSAEQKKVFAHITPDFIAEVISPSDNLKQFQHKMQKWIENGVKLGWLIDPKTPTTFIYRADGTISKVTGLDKVLSGEDVLQGFEFDLNVLII